MMEILEQRMQRNLKQMKCQDDPELIPITFSGCNNVLNHAHKLLYWPSSTEENEKQMETGDEKMKHDEILVFKGMELAQFDDLKEADHEDLRPSRGN